MEKEFFSTGEVAQILGISRIAVFKKIKKRDIQATKVGRNFVIQRSELPKLLGKVLSEHKKDHIESVVKKIVKEYGDTLKKLSKE